MSVTTTFKFQLELIKSLNTLKKRFSKFLRLFHKNLSPFDKDGMHLFFYSFKGLKESYYKNVMCSKTRRKEFCLVFKLQIKC